MDPLTQLITLKKDDCIFLPKTCQLEVICKLHNNALAGHNSRAKTLVAVS